jgi:flagellar biosynthesis protein FliQ
MYSLLAAQVPCHHELASALAPATDRLTGNVVGLSVLAIPLVFALLVGLLFVAHTRFGSFLLGWIWKIVAILIILSVIGGVLTALVGSGSGC